MSVQTVVVKIFALIFLFIATVFAGILPIKLRGKTRNGREVQLTSRRRLVLSLCNCFAGGVFFGTSFLDLFPLIHNKFELVFQETGIKTVFPVAEFTTSIGLFMILIIEQVVHTWKERSRGHKEENNTKSPEDEVKTPLLEDNKDKEFSNAATSRINNESQSAPANKQENCQGSNLRSYMLLLALSMHSLFEGLAVGLMKNLEQLAQIVVAVTIHKSILSFGLGANLVQHNMPSSNILKSATCFAITGPIGIAIGISVLKYASTLAGNLASGILQGIANGTFLYVTFFEIFMHELREKTDRRMLKILFMVIGYSIVSVLVLLYG